MFKSLKTRIVALSATGLVLSLSGLVIANYVTTQKRDTEVIQDQLNTAAKGGATTVAVWVRAKQLSVESMKQAVEAQDPVPFLKAGAAAGDFSATYIAFPDKRYAFSDSSGVPKDFDPTTRPWYKQAVAVGGKTITPAFKAVTGANAGKWVITFAEAVNAGGALQAAIGASITTEQMVAIVSAIKPTEHSYAFLVGGNGTVIAHADEALSMKPSTEVAKELTVEKLKDLSKGGSLFQANLKNRDVFLRVMPVEGSDWMLAVALDREDATAGLRAMVKTSLITATIAIVLAVLVLAALLTKSLRRLTEVRDAMQDVASGEGDLTIRISEAGNDELSQIAHAYNRFAIKLSHVIKDIRTSSEAVKVGASEIAQGNTDLSSRTEQQASSLEETAASMEELTSTVKQNAENARQANQLASASAQHAENGGSVMAEVVETMSAISATSNKIGDIIGVIDGIAFQTNILALNAAVEAARAGEQGRGFAVVATEVRSLAQRSASAAKEIKTLIDGSAEQVGIGVKLVEKAGAAMEDIVGSIKRVNDITTEITAASNEQSVGIGQVHEAITQMDQVTQQNAALVEEAAAAATSLQEQAAALAAAVAQFKLDETVDVSRAIEQASTTPAATTPVNVARIPVNATPVTRR